MAKSYQCQCGKEALTGENGAKGHIKFSEGGIHGGHMELPDNWRDLLTVTTETDDEDDDVDEDVADDGETTDAPDEPKESNSDEPRGSQSKGRITRLLTTPVDELIRGSQ